jgi:plastocyanin
MRNSIAPGIIARRGLLLGALRLAGGVAMLGATMRVVAAKDGTEIGIDNFKFAPTPLMVPKGATVTWVNRDDIPHSIVCQTLGFRSHPMDTDGSASLIFDQPGRYEYICGLHPFMRGTVIVQS